MPFHAAPWPRVYPSPFPIFFARSPPPQVYNTARRLLLTCGVLLTPSLGATTLLAVFLGLLTLAVEQNTRAHINPTLSAFSVCCCWQVVLFILFLLLLDSRLTRDSEQVAISALLMIANLCLVVTVFADSAFVARLRARARAKEGEGSPPAASLESASGGGESGIELQTNPMHGGGGAATTRAEEVPNTDVVVMTVAPGGVASDGAAEARVEDAASAAAVAGAVPGDEAGEASQAKSTQWATRRPMRRSSIQTVRGGEVV